MKQFVLIAFILFFQNPIQSQTPEEIYGKNLDVKISYYDSIIRLKPFSGEYFNRAYLYYLNKEYDNALSDYNKAISLDSTNHEFFSIGRI
ncbi:tetratricopeptide repeat protein [Flavobacterium humi]|uniref:Tetratricopeptide repeat protein n=1 Tax=Flavobacterium humi TaxID=2562683 RepID=A0A4Z0L7E3_9FLAO|nr:tetratricopeptide repeat protein [Flavobacterium humi]TGD56912.1 tetratricopeptide repeat protein [Flavobacterium humi]